MPFPAQTSSASLDAPRPAIVLIEDSLAYARLIELLLAEALPGGADLRHFSRLDDALGYLADTRPDCILLDLTLPDSSGLSGIAALRAAEVLSSIIVLSGHADEATALGAIQAGAQDYLVKGEEQQNGTLARAIRYAIERSAAQERSELLLRAKEDRYRTLAQLAPAGIFESDAAGNCTFANERYAQLTGRPVAELHDSGWQESLHPDDHDRVVDGWAAAIAAPRRDGVTWESRFLQPTGGVVHIYGTAVPLVAPDGEVGGWLGSLTDITDLRQATERLRDAEERFRRAFEDAPYGMVIVTLDRCFERVNRAFCEMLGRPEGELTSAACDDLTHPDDRAGDAAKAAEMIAGKQSMEWEKRFLHADGRPIWVRLSASLIRNAAGDPVHFVAQVEDVTGRRAAEQELQRQQLDLMAIAALSRQSGGTDAPFGGLCIGARRILDADFASLWLEDSHGLLELVAEDGLDIPLGATLRIGGATSGAVSAFLARERVEIADARGNPGVSQAFAEATGTRTIVFEPILHGSDCLGVLSLGWYEVTSPLPARQLTSTRLIAAELAAAVDRVRLLDQLRELARTDHLTGLPNRRSWEDRVTLEMARASRYARPLCVAMLDLDHFKAYNDRHGHQAGDRLLRETTAAWQGHLRTTDLLARLGGDEFGVLLPDCDETGAVEIIERLRRSVPAPLGCSAGIIIRADGEQALHMIARADEAMYAAKEAGRGRTVVA